MFSEVEKVRHMPEVRLSEGFVCISWELFHGFDFELMNEHVMYLKLIVMYAGLVTDRALVMASQIPAC